MIAVGDDVQVRYARTSTGWAVRVIHEGQRGPVRTCATREELREVLFALVDTALAYAEGLRIDEVTEARL